MTANKPMTGEQLEELMTIAVNMQRDSEKVSDRPVAMFAYAVQVAVLELRKVRNEAMALAVENAGLKKFITQECHVAHVEPETFYEEEITRYVNADGYEPETTATDTFLAEVRAQARNEGINYAASRLAAAFNHGFVDKPLTEVCDVVRMILDTKEDLAKSTLPAVDGLSGEYAEAFLEFSADQLRQEATQ